MSQIATPMSSSACAAEGESASSLTSAVAVSASTLAEDVRQLAQWCRNADDARDQQDNRLEQLECMPPLQAQLKALQDKVCIQHRQSLICMW